MNFPIRPVLDEIIGISSLGFDYVELTLDPPNAHHALIRKQEKEIRRVLEDSGLGLICHLPTFVFTADLTEGIREASVREVLDALKTGADLNPEIIVLHPGYIGGLGPLVMDRSVGFAKKSFEEIFTRARSLGVSLCLENMFPRYPGWVEPEDFLPMINAYESLMLTLDIGHANIESKSGNRILDFITTFKRNIGHVHASDNFGREDSHLPIGAGNIDFKKTANALKTIGYDGTITLEVFSREKRYLKLSKEILAELFDA
ncbi:MAG: sugar phosphate isomerase/epimerase family protein [Thermodesulfobacteriota bacterium]